MKFSLQWIFLSFIFVINLFIITICPRLRLGKMQWILPVVLMDWLVMKNSSHRLITYCVTANWVCYERLSYKSKHLSLKVKRFVMGVIDHKNTFQYDVKLIDVYVLEKNLIAYAHECTFKIHNLHIFCTLKHFVPFYTF